MTYLSFPTPYQPLLGIGEWECRAHEHVAMWSIERPGERGYPPLHGLPCFFKTGSPTDPGACCLSCAGCSSQDLCIFIPRARTAREVGIETQGPGAYRADPPSYHPLYSFYFTLRLQWHQRCSDEWWTKYDLHWLYMEVWGQLSGVSSFLLPYEIQKSNGLPVLCEHLLSPLQLHFKNPHTWTHCY